MCRRLQRHLRLRVLCHRSPSRDLQRRAGLPVARGERRLPLPALPQAPLSEDLIERALQHLDFRSGDLLRSACLGKNRSLVHDVHEVLDLIRRCTCSGCVAGLLQGHLGAVQLSRRQRTHARRAARALHRRIRLLQCRMPGRGGAAGRERGDEEKRRGGAQPQRAPVQDTHRRAPDSGTVAASREPAGLLLHLLAQLARDRLCLRRLRLDLGKLGVHRRLFRQGARSLGRLGADRGLRRLQLVLGARQLDRRIPLGTCGARARDGQLRSTERFIRHGRLSAPGERRQREGGRGKASRSTPPDPLSAHAVCSPTPMFPVMRRQR